VLESPRAGRTALPVRSHLDWLESEAIFILREVAGECANPVLFFSGGKDSIVLLRLAEKAFRPAKFPFSAHAYRHRAQFPGGDRIPRRPRRRTRSGSSCAPSRTRCAAGR